MDILLASCRADDDNSTFDEAASRPLLGEPASKKWLQPQNTSSFSLSSSQAMKGCSSPTFVNDAALCWENGSHCYRISEEHDDEEQGRFLSAGVHALRRTYADETTDKEKHDAAAADVDDNNKGGSENGSDMMQSSNDAMPTITTTTVRDAYASMCSSWSARTEFLDAYRRQSVEARRDRRHAALVSAATLLLTVAVYAWSYANADVDENGSPMNGLVPPP